MSMTSDVAVAWLLLVAPTVRPPPVTAFPAKFAIVAPLTFAVGRFVPPETTPPPAPSELAVAWLTLPAVTLMVDVGWTSAEPPTVAFTFASLVICAIAAEPERATTPMPVKKVSAIVVFAPPAMTVIVDEPVTSPDRSAPKSAAFVNVTPPLIVDGGVRLPVAGSSPTSASPPFTRIPPLTVEPLSTRPTNLADASTVMPPVVLMLAAAPTNASTAASFVTSADATAPVAVASAPTASTLASAYALLRPRA